MKKKELLPIQLPISQEAELHPDFPFRIYEERNEEIREDEVTVPHRHDFYELIFISSGYAVSMIDLETCRVRECDPPTILVIAPGQIHYWQEMHALNQIVVRFQEEFLLQGAGRAQLDWMLETLLRMAATPRLTADAREWENMDNLLRAILLEYEEQAFKFQAVLKNYLEILLIQICRIYRQAHAGLKASETVSRVARFKQLALSKSSARLSVKDYAAELGVSAGYLSELVRGETGRTPGQLLRQAVVLEAKRLLANTEMNISEVAEVLEFEDVSYFSRVFRQETGMTPTVFRRKYR